MRFTIYDLQFTIGFEELAHLGWGGGRLLELQDNGKRKEERRKRYMTYTSKINVAGRGAIRASCHVRAAGAAPSRFRAAGAARPGISPVFDP